MKVPVFGKAVALANLSCIAIAVCAIVPFDKGRIDRMADGRGFYRRFNLRLAPKNRSQINLNDPALTACLMNRRIFQTLCRHTARAFWPAPFACGGRLKRLPVSLQNRLLIWLILVRGHQIHQTPLGSFLKIKDQGLNVLRRPFAWDNAHDQTMFRIIGDMIPVVALSPVRRVLVMTVFLFLEHKGPFLIELSLGGLWGKGLPVHHEAFWHVRPPGVNNASLYFYLRPPDGLSVGRHSFRTHAQVVRRLCSHPASYGTAVCLFVRKIAFCTFDSTADGSGSFGRIGRIRSDYWRCVFRNPGIFYSGNKIVKEPASSCLLNVNHYGTNACPSLRVSAKTSKIMQLC